MPDADDIRGSDAGMDRERHIDVAALRDALIIDGAVEVSGLGELLRLDPPAGSDRGIGRS